jgi:hypothetical protein
MRGFVTAPQVWIVPEALQKMQYIIDCNADEVGWLGTVQKFNMKDGSVVLAVKDIYLFEQEVAGATCEITPEGLAKVAEEILADAEHGVEIYNSLMLWGHSHVNMAVNPSGQDEEQMKVFKDSGHKWFLRCIGNKKGEMKFTYFDYAQGIVWDDIAWDVYYPVSEGLKEKIEAEVKTKVRKMSYAYNKHDGEVWDWRTKSYVPDAEYSRGGYLSEYGGYDWDKRGSKAGASEKKGQKKEEKQKGKEATVITMPRTTGELLMKYGTGSFIRSAPLLNIPSAKDVRALFEDDELLMLCQCKDRTEVEDMLIAMFLEVYDLDVEFTMLTIDTVWNTACDVYAETCDKKEEAEHNAK